MKHHFLACGAKYIEMHLFLNIWETYPPRLILPPQDFLKRFFPLKILPPQDFGT